MLLSRHLHAGSALLQTLGHPLAPSWAKDISHPAEGPPVSPSMLPTAPCPCNEAMGQVSRTRAPGPKPPSCDSSASPHPARQHIEKGGGGSTRIFLFVINVHVESHWWVSYNSRESPDAAAPGAAS